MKHRVLFVCLGNICRSPAADAIMHAMVERRGIAGDFHIDSAGTYGGHAGELPNPSMSKAAMRRGYRMEHRARQFVKEDFDRFDIILTMDEQNYRNVSWMGDGHRMRKVHRMVEFCRRSEVKAVPDPYGEGVAAFEHVLDILEDACEGLIEHLVAK